MNRLFYGDNLDVLRRYILPETVDLIYLDPPFNSRREYNVIFKERSGAVAASQQQAFLDSWDWPQAADTYAQVIESGGKVAEALQALHVFLGPSDMLAYLVMMAPRLVELRRVLKPTGSIYLHCDPTASHYLKMLMDAVFGRDRFQNEIIWKRSHSHNSARRFGPVHDVLLFYSQGQTPVWNQAYQSYDEEYTKKHYRHVDPTNGRRYKHENPTGAGIRHGQTGKPWRGIDPTAKGRHWVRPPDELERLDATGGIYWPKKAGAWPYIKTYLDERLGMPAQDVWTDISVINMMAKERVGYPTQKPEDLLQRIVSASSNDGEIVLDPFCGCGTTVSVAQRLHRRWIGIDITARAIDIIVERLRRDYGTEIDGTYETSQYPYSEPDARRLAKENPFHFQRWALERLGVNPSDIKPGADRGIDGRLFFVDGNLGRTKRVVLSAKGGQRVGPQAIRDLRGVLDRDGFEIGVLVTAEAITSAAEIELASGRRYYETSEGRRFLRLQHITVADIFNGRMVEFPGQHDLRPSQVAELEPQPESLELDFEGNAESREARLNRVRRPKSAKTALKARDVRERSRRSR